VFQLAANVIQSRFLGESTRLMLASEQYFAQHPNERMASADVVRSGWVVRLPRLRDRQATHFGHAMTYIEFQTEGQLTNDAALRKHQAIYT